MSNTPLVGNIIEGFPYPERHCPYCEHELDLMQAVHMQDNLEQFKAVFMCFNQACGAYDEEGHQAYARIYYSSPFAEENLYEERIWIVRPFKT